MDDEKEYGNLVITINKFEYIEIADGDEKIDIYFYDRFKQPIAGRVCLRTTKKYVIKRRPKHLIASE